MPGVDTTPRPGHWLAMDKETPSGSIPCQRHLFDIPDDVAYLNCAYMSPLMTAVRDAGHNGVDRKVQPWTLSPTDFFGESERARALFARLINARADDIAIVPSASYGLSVAAANLPVSAGRDILVLRDQFPSNIYPWRDLAVRNGARVRTLTPANDGNWTAAVCRAIGDNTAVVALPNTLWTDGSLIGLEEVGVRAREAGAALVLDLTQSLGALPFDAARVQPDFAVCATYKWLLGPYSMGFLYAAPRHHGGRPLEHGWVQRAGSENFARLVDYRDAYQPGARRFDVGEFSNFALMPMVVAALEQVLAWDPVAIQTTLRTLTDGIAARAEAMGLASAGADRRAGHFLGLRFPGGVPADLPERLARDKVFVSVRGDSLRVTPHLYNTPADIDRLFAVLETL